MVEMGLNVTLLIQGPTEHEAHELIGKRLRHLGCELPFQLFPDPWKLSELLKTGGFDVAYLADHSREEAAKAGVPMIEARGLRPFFSGVSENVRHMEMLLRLPWGAAMKALKEYSIKAQNMGPHERSAVSLFTLFQTPFCCCTRASAANTKHRQPFPNMTGNCTRIGARAGRRSADSVLIRGAAERIGPYVRTWKRRRNPGVNLCCEFHLSGNDRWKTSGRRSRRLASTDRTPSSGREKNEDLTIYIPAMRMCCYGSPNGWTGAPGLRHPGEVALLGLFL